MTLSRREKRLILLSLAFACLLGIVIVLILPFFEQRDALRRGIRQKERDLTEIIALSAKHRAMDGRWDDVKARLARRPKDFTLFSFLESAAGGAGLKDRIAYMKPSVTPGKGNFERVLVEIKVEGVTMKQLVAYLYAVESQQYMVSMDRLSIGESRTASCLLDAVLQISTIRRT
jgi:general secretion pathway protein M